MNACVSHDVLYVDDDPITLMLVERKMRHSGLSLKTCNSGSAALDYLENSIVQLLLVDLHMKPMNGLELLQILHKQKDMSTIKTYIATSAVPDEQIQTSLNELGIGFILKSDALRENGIARLLLDHAE